ncbi:MAG: rod shape-determining protein MreC [Candidatus Babeliales bacterium]
MKWRIVLYMSMGILLIGMGARTTLSLYSAEQLSAYLMYPVLVTQQHVVTPIKNFFAEKQTVHTLQQEVTLLQKERDALLAQTIELKSLLYYSDEIKELVDFKKQYEYEDALLVPVLVRNMSDQSHFFLVDGGENKGIEKNMIAVYSNGLIGKVEEVYPQYSKVVLITDRLCKVAATCIATNTCGIYEGCNDERVGLLNRVSHLDTVQEGDLVISSGQGLVFPRGFALGTIKKYTQDGLTYHVELEPLFDLASLNYCFILAKR